MIIGIPSEIKAQEFRVSMIPSSAKELTKRGHRVLVQAGAGAGASYGDELYATVGAEIVATADATMVACGDLAQEIPPEKVFFAPEWQTEQANIAAKPTDTQMLESGLKAPIPTRAEASDVANAALDGTDRGMLPGECAGGDQAIDAVTILSQICAEETISGKTTFSDRTPKDHTVLRGRRFSCLLSAMEQLRSSSSLAPRTESGGLARPVSSDATMTRQMNGMRVGMFSNILPY